MKAEHRKELQTNALADRVGRFFKGVRTRAQNSSAITWAVVAIVVAVILIWWFATKSAARTRSQTWVEMDTIAGEEQAAESGGLFPAARTRDLDKTEEQLRDLIQQRPGSKAALMARFQLARIKLRDRGLEWLPDRGSKALANLKAAREEYEKLAEETRGDPYWEPQALWGAAQAVEGTAAENIKRLDDAAALYRQLAEKFPNSAPGKEAARRAKQFDSKQGRQEVEEFYRDLADNLHPERSARK